ncbi:hypothetical protein D3C78_928480 [compost metagenome]
MSTKLLEKLGSRRIRWGREKHPGPSRYQLPFFRGDAQRIGGGPVDHNDRNTGQGLIQCVVQIFHQEAATVGLSGSDELGPEHHQTATDPTKIYPMCLISQGGLGSGHHGIGMTVTQQHGGDTLTAIDTSLPLQTLVQPGIAVAPLRLNLGNRSRQPLREAVTAHQLSGNHGNHQNQQQRKRGTSGSDTTQCTTCGDLDQGVRQLPQRQTSEKSTSDPQRVVQLLAIGQCRYQRPVPQIDGIGASPQPLGQAAASPP